LAKINPPIERALRDAQIQANELTDVILVGGTTKMKLIQDYLSYLLKRPISVKIDQDKAIALGCGIATGIKARNADIKDVVLTDICPFTLGIKIVGNVFSPIIERNTTLPASRVQQYCTVEPGQNFIRCEIYQGENYKANTNLLLGTMSVPVPINLEHLEAIDVRFSYDINGILDVDITVVSTGKKYSKTILRDRHQLSSEEILKRRMALSKLKIHPREDEFYQFLMARAERLFQNLLNEQRAILTDYIRNYEAVIESQNLSKIKKAHRLFEKQLEQLENWGGM
jgi:molecular chaperone HscC